jgi:hypothetical protein
MITDSMVGKVYDRINFQDHGEEGIAEVFRDHLADLLDGADLEAVQAALVRERVIRDVMRDSGEERQHVADMLDAMASVSQEGVEELTDGEPTTLRDALQRYVESLPGPDGTAADWNVAEDLGAILNYPFPGPSVELEIERPDDETLTVKVDGELIAGANHDDHGWAGMDLLETTARNVHKAVVDRLNRG